MDHLTYVPASTGGWTVLAHAPRLLALTTAPAPLLAADVLAALADGSGFQATLDLLTRAGLSATPDFLLVEVLEGRTRIIVRGDLPVHYSDESGDHELSGAEVSTWSERSIPGLSTLSVTVPAAEAASTALTLAVGAAYAAAISLFAEPSGARADGQPAAAAGRGAGQPAGQRPAAAAAAADAPGAATPTPAKVPTGERPKAAPAVAPAVTPAVARATAPQPAAQAAPAGTAPVPAPVPAQVSEPVSEVTVTEFESAQTGKDPDATSTGGPASDAPKTAGYDYLFGDTVFHSVADAAVRPEDEDEDEDEDGNGAGSTASDGAPAGQDAPRASAREAAGDHDGHTVMTSDIAALRAGRGRKSPAKTTPVDATPLFVLEFASGARESVGQSVILGRAPSATKISGGRIPRLITVGGADQDISRSHAQFVVEGDTVVVTDLHSRNGTLVTLPGKDTRKLRAGEPTAVILGTLVDFGGGITLTIGRE